MTYLKWAYGVVDKIADAKFEQCAEFFAYNAQGKVIISLLVNILEVLAAIADMIRQQNRTAETEAKYESV